MKKFELIAVAIFCMFFFKTSLGQNYFIYDYSFAVKKAKSENKRIFVDFGAEWCMPCKTMDKQVLSDSMVKNFLLKDYICLKLDFDDDKSLMKKYSVKTFPKFLILSKNGELIYSWTGASSKETFLNKFKSAPQNSIEKDRMDSLYHENKSDMEFLYSYYNILRQYRYYEKASQIADKILKKDKNWQDKRNMNLILDNIGNKKYKNYLLKNKSVFEQKFSVDSINFIVFLDYIKNHYREDISNSTLDIQAIKSDMKKLFGNSGDYFSSKYFVNLLEDKENQWNVYFYSLVYVLKYPNNIFTNDVIYNKITKALLRNLTISELNALYEGINNQFNLNYDFNLKYYDLKALAEFKLGLKENANKTLETANKISIEKEGKPYDSILNVLISLLKQ